MLVYPWKGLLANVERTFVEEEGRYVTGSGKKLMEYLTSEGFTPYKVQPLWNSRGHTGFAIVDFGEEWEGVRNGILFENHFEAKQRGKREFDGASERGDKLYGWVAKEEDYHSKTIFGYHLREQGVLKSVSGKEAEDQRKALILVNYLKNTLETKNSSLQQMESKYKKVNKIMDLPLA